MNRSDAIDYFCKRGFRPDGGTNCFCKERGCEMDDGYIRIMFQFEEDVVLAYHTYHEYNRHTGKFMCRFEHSIYRYTPKDPANPFHNERYIYAYGEYQLA